MAKLLYLHQGLGDFLNMSAGIFELSQKELILLPCEAQGRKLENVKNIFRDMNVRLLPVNPTDDPFAFIEKWGGIGVGWYSKRNCTINDFNVRSHIREAYEKIGADYDNRGQHDPIARQVQKVKQLPVPREPYAFMPEGGSTNQFRIDRKYVSKGLLEIIPPQDSIMFEYADIIANATELHCHDCGWPWVIDKIPTSGHLFFHKYARPESKLYDYGDIMLKNWKIIE